MRQLCVKKNPDLDTKVDKSNPVISSVLEDSRFSGSGYARQLLNTDGSNMWVGNSTNLDALYFQTKTVNVGVHTILERLSAAETNISTISTNGKIVSRTIYSGNVNIASPTRFAIATPSDCKRFLCCILRRAWPTSSWTNGAVCTLCDSYESNGTIVVQITTTSPQIYDISLSAIIAI